MDFLDWLTLISYTALNVDVVLQIHRIYNTKSSRDLSMPGMTIRFIAIGIILIKFIELGDMPLLLGQALIASTFTIYFILAVAYARHKKKSKRR